MRGWILLVLTFASGCYMRHGLSDRDGARDAGQDADVRDTGAWDADVWGADVWDADVWDADVWDAGALDAGPDAGCVGRGCEVAAGFDGLRWELPCSTRSSMTVCDTEPERVDQFEARGAPGAQYAVTLRFRGVVELSEYSGGAADGPFYVGGRHYDGAWNLYALEVGSPRQTFFLNSGVEGRYFCVAIDYAREILVDTGARVRLIARSIDDRQIINIDELGSPIVIPDVPPDPVPFDGQFIQMDVVGVRRVR